MAGVSADAPASVIVHETPETITVGVSDPTHLNTGAVRVTLSEAKAAKVAEEHPEVKVVSLSPSCSKWVWTVLWAAPAALRSGNRRLPAPIHGKERVRSRKRLPFLPGVSE